MRKQVLWLIVISTVVRMTLAYFMGFGVDETYELCLARTFSWSYFEFPPIVAWIPHFIMTYFHSESTLLIRLPFILFFSGTTWLMYKMTARLFSEYAGFYAALTLNLAGVFFLQGSWALPDVPLEFFMMATVMMLSKIIFPEDERKSVANIYINKLWLFAGILFGLAMMSKYHAVFIPFGFVLFCLTTSGRRNLLLSWRPYMAATVALLIFAPVIYWNGLHDWITVSFQGSRYDVRGIFFGKMLVNIAGQIAWLLPWIWLPLILQTGRVLVAKLLAASGDALEKKWFLFCLGIGPLVLFTSDALFGSWVYPHWLMPGYLFLFPLLGCKTAEWIKFEKKRWTVWWLRLSATALLLILIILGSHTVTGWMKDVCPNVLGKEDYSLDTVAWNGLQKQLEEKGWLENSNDKLFIVTPHWIDASKVDWVMGKEFPVLCLDGNPHHYVFMHDQADFKGRDALIIGREKAMETVYDRYKNHFAKIEILGVIWLGRGGRQEIPITVMRGIGYKGDFPMPYGIQN